MINTPICITIAGSDSCAGAGIQADIKSFSAHNCYAMSVITASTAQTHLGITDIQPLSSAHVGAQLEGLLRTYSVAAIKTGMLCSPSQVNAITDVLCKYNHIPLVVDPVFGSSAGNHWSSKELIDSYLSSLIPRASVITPNTAEAQALFGLGENTESLEHLREFAKQHNIAILLKGGHAPTKHEVIDHLVQVDCLKIFRHPRIESVNTHGTGCTLASAITAQLALGHNLEHACELAIEYIDKILRHSKDFLTPNAVSPLRNLPMNHFFEI